MHDIEPYYRWRDHYVASQDERSPFYGREYSEFHFTNKVYNYLIHPQWDEFGSSTLYMKILYTDYNLQFAVIELLGEWNDCIQNDIMYLKRNIADRLIEEGVRKFILIGENVLNFHGSDDCYYREWIEDIRDEEGWISLLNIRDHIADEMRNTHLHYHMHFGYDYNGFNWRKLSPKGLLKSVDEYVDDQYATLPE